MIKLGSHHKVYEKSLDNQDLVRISGQDTTIFSQFAELCNLVVKCSQKAFSIYIRQASSLYDKYTEWLQQPEIHINLRRLKCRGFFTDTQWKSLFPRNKSLLDKNTSTLNFPAEDLSLLMLLLKYTGIVSEPEPGGWLHNPDINDQTAGSQLVRLQSIRRHMASLTKMNDEIFNDLKLKIRSILMYFGGLEIEEFMDMLEKEELSQADLTDAYNSFVIWHTQEEQITEIEKQIEEARKNSHNEIPLLQTSADGGRSGVISSINRKGIGFRNTSVNSSFNSLIDGPRWNDIINGIPDEEKGILRDFYVRLINEVRPDSMIDQLLSKKILNIEESGEVFSSLQSTEQMKVLLNILVTKSGHAFIEFLNALKTRYHELYMEINEAYQLKKQEILANKPEGVSYCHSFLINFYNKKYCAWTPILWYPESIISLQQFYCSLQLLDSQGNSIEETDILSHKTQNQASHIFIVEGDPGTGKSYLSHILAAKWTQNPSILNNPHNIQLVFHLDLKISSPNLKAMLFDQLFESNMKLTEREVWEVIDRHQNMCLFLLDGYNDNANDDIMQLIKGNIFPNSFVIVFSNSSSTHLLKKYYQEKFVLTGFKQGESVSFARKYIRLTRQSKNRFDNLLQKLARTSDDFNKEIPDFMDSKESTIHSSSDETVSRSQSITGNKNALEPIFPDKKRSVVMKIRAGSIIPGNIMGFTRPSDNKEGRFTMSISSIKEKDSPSKIESNDTSQVGQNTDKTQEKLSALRFYSQFPLYCSFFCAMTDMKMSIDLTSWSGLLEHFFTAIKMKLIEREKESRVVVNRMFANLSELSFESVKQSLSTIMLPDDRKLERFGILKRATPNSVPHTNSESLKMMFANDMVQNFLAAKCLDLYGVDETNTYFQNLTLTKSIYPLVVFYCGIRKSDFDTPALKTLFRKVVDLNTQILMNNQALSVITVKNRHTDISGIMKFQLSLDCVAAMNGRDDLTDKVGETLPTTLLIQHSCTIPVLTLQGLSYIIEKSCPNITQLDLRLNYLSRQTPEAFQNLANSIHKNKSIKILKIFWEQLELMSLFYNTVCEFNETILDIQIFDESNHRYENFNSKIAHNIRCGCKNMKSAERFAFVDCTFATLTHAIIRNLGDNLISLDLSGCSFTIIACNDLAEKICKTKTLKSLILSRAKMQSMPFNTFIQSIGSNRTITELNLDHIKMDNVSFFTLAEALKLNNRLETLSLKEVSINDRSCDEIIQVLKVNTTLKTIYVSGGKVAPSGRVGITKQAKNTKIVGLEKLVIKPKESQKNDIYID